MSEPLAHNFRPTYDPDASYLCLLEQLQGVIHFNPQVADSRFEFGMSEPQLNSAKLLRSTTDESGHGSSYGVGPMPG